MHRVKKVTLWYLIELLFYYNNSKGVIIMKAKYIKRPDGRYGTTVWDGTYKNGNKHYVFVQGSSSRELEEKVRKIELQRETGGVLISDDIKLLEYARKWLKTSKKTREKATYASYENIIEKRLGELAFVRVCDIKHSHIQDQINELSATPRTCQLFILTMKQIMKSACRDRLIPKGYDVFEDISMPSYKPKERRILTDTEKSILKNYVLQNEPSSTFTGKEKCFLALLYHCGIRREEALALTRFDIKENLCINKAIGFDKNNPYLKETKTGRGRREIPIPTNVREMLEDYMKTLEGPLLFPGTDYYMTHSIYVKFWDRIRNKMAATITDKFPNWEVIGIKDLTAHIFRHNFCTMLCYESLKNGTVSTKKIAQLLGDTEAMVLGVYGHLMEKEEKPKEAVINALAL